MESTEVAGDSPSSSSSPAQQNEQQPRNFQQQQLTPQQLTQAPPVYEYEAWTGHSRLSEATARNNRTRATKGFSLAVTVDDATGRYTAVLMRDGTSMRATEITPGSHAFVKAPGEQHLRVALKGTKFGEAAGHPNLASEGDVQYAGHIDLQR